MTNFILSILVAYLIGSIPTSFICAKMLKRIDIRKYGSGNVGATNIFRVVGKIPALFVLIFDIAKGVITLSVVPSLFFNNELGIFLSSELYKIILALSVISGHLWSIFLKFSGGKGVATTAGVLAVLAPKVLFGAIFIWLVIFVIFRIVSIASIAASLFLPVFAILFYNSTNLVLFCALLCVMGTYKHKPNIRRLLRGEEKRLF